MISRDELKNTIDTIKQMRQELQDWYDDQAPYGCTGYLDWFKSIDILTDKLEKNFNE